MYECHGWFCLSDSTLESDNNALRKQVDEIRARIQDLPSSMVAEIHVLNGQYSLTLTSNTNRRTGETIEDLIELIRQHLPGSWGLLYERDDNLTEPPGPNLYQVTVLARGNLTKRYDPFL